MTDENGKIDKSAAIKTGVAAAGIAGAGIAGAAAFTAEEVIERINMTGTELEQNLTSQFEMLQGQLEAKMGELSEHLSSQMESTLDQSIESLNSNSDQLKQEMVDVTKDTISDAVSEGREEMASVLRESQEELNHIAQQVEYAIREHKDRAIQEMASFKDELERFTGSARAEIESEIEKVRLSATDACGDIERVCGTQKEHLESTSQVMEDKLNAVADSALSQMRGSVVVDESGREAEDDVEFT